VAREIIGKTLIRTESNGLVLSGIIVESEAYGGNKDPASHAFRGKTARNEVMFGEAGHAYVYFTYGFHYCLNFVTSSRYGKASAILIRAVEPILGVEEMKARRKKDTITELASGPGKLCQAFLIDRTLNGIDVTRSDSIIRVEDSSAEIKIRISTRIGIKHAADKMWRFYSSTSPHVSKHSTNKIRTGKLIYPCSNSLLSRP
jgi:DNA-3-methyladenine glycosylase